VIEELFGLFEVTHALVDVKLVEEVRDCFETLVSQSTSIDLKFKIVLSFSIFYKLNFHQFRISFSYSTEDRPCCPDVSLTPEFLLNIIEHQSSDSLIEHLHPASVEDIVPFLFSSRKEDIEWLVKMDQMESYGVSSALFITRMKFTELLGPSLRRRIECCDLCSSERILNFCLVKV